MTSPIAQMFEQLSPGQIREFLLSLSAEEVQAVLDDWSLWQMPHQRLPVGFWRTWIIRAGRGSGKTYSGAKWVNEIARDKDKIKDGEIGIVAKTWSNARNTCVEDPASGILATAPSDFKPEWSPGNKILTWPNGVRGRVCSADNDDSLRGLNLSFLWADEICFWPKPEKTWGEVLNLALRKGWSRALITTTPLPDPFLRALEELDSTVVTRASTYDNKFLSKDVLKIFEDQYKGTRRGNQELYGEFLDTNLNALWQLILIERARIDPATFDYDKLTRIVVAVDPAVTANDGSDSTGIIVVGSDNLGNGYILEDRTMKGKPHEWARAAVEAYHDWNANLIVAEVNQGGDLVESNIRQIDSKVAYKSVRAKKNKQLRAEPVATAYEQGKVFHVGYFPQLEDQQINWEPGKPSPDRLDAAVYGLTELILDGEPPRDNKKIAAGYKALMGSLGRSGWR